MSETRPTREECIRVMHQLWGKFPSGDYDLVLEATIHYLTDSATPDLFAQNYQEKENT